MSRSCRNSQEKKSNDNQRGRFAESRSFFVQKNPLPRMIADMGAGARYHSVKNDMGGDKKSATMNDSGYGCRGTLSYFITA